MAADSAKGKQGMDLQQHATEVTLAAIGSKATYAGAWTSVVGWLMSSEFGVVAGILLGICGLLVNWHYRRKQDKRDEARHARDMGRP